MPTMRISLLNVDSDVTPLKFRGWLRNETLDIQGTARDAEDIITIRLFMPEKLRFAITPARLDRMLKAVVEKHPNIYRVELQVRPTALSAAEFSSETELARSDLKAMGERMEAGANPPPPTLH